MANVKSRNCGGNDAYDSSSGSMVEILSQRLTHMEEQLELLKSVLKDATNQLKCKEREITSLQNQVALTKRAKKSSRDSLSTDQCVQTEVEKPMTKSTKNLENECQMLSRKVQEMEKYFGDHGLLWVTEDALLQDDPKKLWVRKTNIHHTPDFDKVFVVVEELNLRNSDPQIVRRGNSAQFENVDTLNLTLYADGIQLESNPFREYDSPSVQEFFRDLEDGYFPTELKWKHPEGVMFKVKDRRHMKYIDDPDQKAFAGNGTKLGTPDRQKLGILNDKAKSPAKSISPDSEHGGKAAQDGSESKTVQPSNINTPKIPVDQKIKVEPKTKLSDAKSKTQFRRSSTRSTVSSKRRKSFKNTASSPIPMPPVDSEATSLPKPGLPHKFIPSPVKANEKPDKILQEMSTVDDPSVLVPGVKPETRKQKQTQPEEEDDKLKQLFSRNSPMTSLPRVPMSEFPPSPINAAINKFTGESSLSKLSSLPVAPESPGSGKSPMRSIFSPDSPNKEQERANFKNEESQTSKSCLKGIKNESVTTQIPNFTNITINQPLSIYMPNEPSTIIAVEGKRQGDALLNVEKKDDGHQQEKEASRGKSVAQTKIPINVRGETEYRDKYTDRVFKRTPESAYDAAPRQVDKIESPQKLPVRNNVVDTTIRYDQFTYLGAPRDAVQPAEQNLTPHTPEIVQLNEKTSETMITVKMKTAGNKELQAHFYPNDPVQKLRSLLNTRGLNYDVTVTPKSKSSAGSIKEILSATKDAPLIVSKANENEDLLNLSQSKPDLDNQNSKNTDQTDKEKENTLNASYKSIPPGLIEKLIQKNPMETGVSRRLDESSSLTELSKDISSRQGSIDSHASLKIGKRSKTNSSEDKRQTSDNSMSPLAMILAQSSSRNTSLKNQPDFKEPPKPSERAECLSKYLSGSSLHKSSFKISSPLPRKNVASPQKNIPPIPREVKKATSLEHAIISTLIEGQSQKNRKSDASHQVNKGKVQETQRTIEQKIIKLRGKPGKSKARNQKVGGEIAGASAKIN